MDASMINVPSNPSQARMFTQPGSIGYSAANEQSLEATNGVKEQGDAANAALNGGNTISSVSGIVPVLQYVFFVCGLGP